jgi:putative permease
MSPHEFRKSMLQVIGVAAALLVLLWFLRQTASVLLLFTLAIVLGIAINDPVTRLERRGMRRIFATLIVFGTILVVSCVVGSLVLPRIANQVRELSRNAPEYVNDLRRRAEEFLGNYPEAAAVLPTNEADLDALAPSPGTILAGAGIVSISALRVVAAIIILFATVFYIVLDPRPLARIYLSLVPPPLHARWANAFARASTMVVGWMKSNIIAGAIEAVVVAAVLGWLQVPGAFVWGGLAFFSELVPKLGPYLMAIPPIIVALAIDPLTALWVTVFYLALNEVMVDFVTPRIQASTMQLHPVSVLFSMLVLGAAFGVVGALVATPVTAFVKAYYEEFYVTQHAAKVELEKYVERIMFAQADDKKG